jgi:hypothetical protein
MPFGVPTTINDQLNSVDGQVGGIFYLVEIIKENTTYRLAERELVWNGNLYSPRVTSISGLKASTQDTSSINIALDNTDGAVTLWDQEGSFLGSKVNIYEYVESLAADYKREVLVDKPAGYWRLGEPSGTSITDSSGNGLTGTYTNGPTLAQTGALANDAATSVSFVAASSQYGVVPDNNLLDFGNVTTYEAWAYPTSSNAANIIDKGPNGLEVAMKATTRLIQVAKTDVAVIVESTVGLTLNAWNHVVVTKSGSDVHIYLNGVDVTGVVTDAACVSTATALQIGRYYNNAFYWNGKLQEIAVYNYALSSKRVAQHYAIGTIMNALTPTGTYVKDAYLKWSGNSDEITELDDRTAQLSAYYGPVTQRLELPKRLVSPQCSHAFGQSTTTTSEIHTSALTTRNFESFECPANRDANTGFRATLSIGINTSDPITFDVIWDANASTGGALFQMPDVIQIDNEVLEISADPGTILSSGGGGTTIQSITCVRGQRGTTIASHSGGATVYFKSCPKSWQACAYRGMRGNNALDTYSSVKRNYFGGFPLIHAGTDSSKIPLPLRLAFKNFNKVSVSGSNSIFGSPLPLIYGNTLLPEPILYLVSDQVSFLSTAWLLGEGVLGTNASDDTLNADPLYMFGSYTGAGDEHVLVNGKKRHDTRPNFGIEAWPGDSDRQPPSTSAFFSTASIPEFSTNKLAFWGTSWLVIKIAKENNETIDINSSITAEIEIKFGRLIRSYNSAPSGAQDANDPALFTRKASTNPAWVLLDVETSKRAGGGANYTKFDIQGFIDTATYCDTLVYDTTNLAVQKKRWTFNGVISNKRSFQDYERAICLGMYCTPPHVNSAGQLTIKPLKAESPVSGSVPFFSDKSASSDERNITWEDGHSSLKKTKKSILEIPNRVIVEYAFKDPVSGRWMQTTGMMNDDYTQQQIGRVLGDNSVRVVSKTVNLLGNTTDDEAARIATLILRAGEFAEGGLTNNQILTFSTFYKTSSDVAIGDIIEVQSDLLDPAIGEQFYRIIDIEDTQIEASGGGFLFERKITASIHFDEIYDDSSGPLTVLSVISHGVPRDGLAPPVTSAGVSETGVFDSNNKMMSELTFTYTEPSPLNNYKNVSVWRSNLANPNAPYNAATNVALDDWRNIGELRSSGDKIQHAISGKFEVFTLLSRNLTGNVPNPTTKTADGTAFFYPRVSVLVDGVTDVLPAPTSFQLFIGSNLISLTWDAYTGNNLKLFKNFRIYRNTVNTFGSAALIATIDGTSFIDTTPAASTVYYYWVAGFSLLNVEGTATSSLHTTSPADSGADTGVPIAPTIGVIRSVASYNANEYMWTIGIDRPGGAGNWGGVTKTHLVVSDNSSFTSPIVDQDYFIRPPFTVDVPVTTPGTYWFEAKVTNSFGDSLYSSPLNRTTASTDVTSDTALCAAPSDLAQYVATDSGKSYLAGNQFEVDFSIPATQAQSFWGYTLISHSSSTLPTATTFDTGTAGSITSGSSVLNDSTKAFGVNALVGKDVVIFSDKRTGSPTWDYEGVIYIARILSNTATTITFDLPAQRVTHNITLLKYYIVNVGNHFYDKVHVHAVFTDESVLSPTDSRSRLRKIVVNAAAPTMYVWVALNNGWGHGKVTASPTSKTFSGITTAELGNASVSTAKIIDANITTTKIADNSISTPKLIANSVTAAKIDVNDLFAQTITASGSITGAVIKTASSGGRVEMDSTNGMRFYNSGGTLVSQITTANAFIVTSKVQSTLTSSLLLSSDFSDTNTITLDTSKILLFTASGKFLDFQVGSQRMKIDDGDSSTQSAMLLRGDGSVRRVSIDNSDLGSGAKRYLYLA